MKYKGIELNEFTSDTPIAFDPPREMFVWDNSNNEPRKAEVYAYLPRRSPRVQCNDFEWYHCAEIPEEPKSRRATNRELAKWLAQGKGEKKYTEETEPDDGCFFAGNDYNYDCSEADSPVDECFTIRKWDDEDWHEPTADYMGLEA